MSEKKVWFITEASSGLGRALAEEILAQGFRVAATARRPEELRDLTEKYPATARAFRLDVTNLRQVKSAIANTVKEFGRIDTVVNNAADGQFDEENPASREAGIFGFLNLTHEVLPILRERNNAHIVNIGSPARFSGADFSLAGWSENLAVKAASGGIKTTNVEPGALSRAGDLRNSARIIGQAVESADPPFRLRLDHATVNTAGAKLNQVAREIARWRERESPRNYDAAIA